ncbi:hypothetical protein AB0J85_24005 [Micromonospora echinofusca]|uniref:hypothetical protein n=1 Tax=Micromonospora echinofusca TaxID=47858 RepID=UPI00341E7594
MVGDRYRHGQTRTVEVLEEPGLPRKISVAPGAGTTDRQVPVDAYAPHVVGDSASERRQAADRTIAARPRWAHLITWARDWWYDSGRDADPGSADDVRAFVAELGATILASEHAVSGPSPGDRGLPVR